MPDAEKTYLYKVDIQDEDILRSLNRIERLLERLSGIGRRAFGVLSNQATAFGFAVGAASAAMSALIDLLVSAGRAGARQIAKLAKESIELASHIQLARVQFEGFFSTGGLDPDQVNLAASAISKLSEEMSVGLGIGLENANELIRRFLPQVDELRQLEELGNIALFLQTRQPEARQFIARALEDALGAGGLQSLRRVFEISEQTITRIQQLQKEIGPVNGLIKGMQENMEDFGFEADDAAAKLRGTAGFLTNQAKAFFDLLKLSFGTPLIDSFSQSLQSAAEIVKENQEEIRAIATAIGEAAARLADFAGSAIIDILQNTDWEQIFEDIQETGRSLGLFADSLRLIGENSDGIVAFLTSSGPMTLALEKLRDVVHEFNPELNLMDVAIGAVTVAFAIINETLVITGEQLGFIGAAIQDFLDLEFEKGMENLSNSTFDWNRLLEKGNEVAAELANRHAELTEEINASTEATNAGSEAGTAAAESLLRERLAAEKLAAAKSAQIEALRETAEEELKIEGKLQEDREKIIRQGEERVASIIRDTRRKMRDENENYTDRVSDIWRKFHFDLAKDERELGDDEAKLLRERAREREEIEQKSRDKELEILQEFNRDRDAILREFGRNAIAAARDRSVVALLAAQDARDEALEEAAISRDESLQDARAEAEQRRQQLRDEFNVRLEELRIANAEEARERELALEFKLEQERINHERAIEQIQQNEQDRIFEENEGAKARIKEAETAAQLKLSKLHDHLAEVNQAVKDAEAEQTAIIKAENDLREEIQREHHSNLIAQQTSFKKKMDSLGTSSGGGASGSFDPLSGSKNILFGKQKFVSPLELAGVFDSGGIVPGPYGSRQVALVKGGETILPTHRADYQPTSGAALTQQINNRNISIDSLAFGSGMNAVDKFLSREEFLYLLRRMQK